MKDIIRATTISVLACLALFLAPARAQPMTDLAWWELWLKSQPTQAQIEQQKQQEARFQSQMCIESLQELHSAGDDALSDYVHNMRNLKHEKQLKGAMKKVHTWCGIK